MPKGKALVSFGTFLACDSIDCHTKREEENEEGLEVD